MPVSAGAIDALFERFIAGEAPPGVGSDRIAAAAPPAPGIAYGLIADGRLAYAGGAGTTRAGEATRPDSQHVFCIASMTKSFTASAVLLLRDRGLLGLDDLVADRVPEAAAWLPTAADESPITIRQLLCMTSGLPSDDPWADRLQALSDADFGRLLGASKTLAWPPGTAFEYSNLGYAILGRIITAVSGRPFADFISAELVQPLGMDSTVWAWRHIDPQRLALGHVWRDGGWLVQDFEDCGAFSAMGGLLSTVEDLALWVAGLCAAHAAGQTTVPGPIRQPAAGQPAVAAQRVQPAAGHPLRAGSRRELQRVHAARPLQIVRSPRGALIPRSEGYGFGLAVWDDTELGCTVSHAGGYPGFGSFMIWHPASRLGVVALANGRYAAPAAPAYAALALLLKPAARTATVRAAPGLMQMKAVVEALAIDWDEALVAAHFAPNMDQDLPLERRRRQLEALVRRHGVLRAAGASAMTLHSGTRASWRLAGERGWVGVEMMLTPDDPPRIQKLEWTSSLEPPPALQRLAEAFVSAWNGGPAAAGPMAALGTAAVALLEPLAREGAVQWGAAAALEFVGGDGAHHAVVRITAERGGADLAFSVDAGDGRLLAAVLTPLARAATPW